MSLVPAKCTQCGANLQVDLSQDASICPYCNTAYITEKAVNNYNTTNITNIDRLHADTVNISTQRVIDDKVTAGNTFVDLEEYEQAEAFFDELIKEYPQEYRGWVGMIKVNTKNCQEKVMSKEKLKQLQFWYERALKVVSEDNKPDLEASCGEYLREVEAQLNARVNTAKVRIDELNTQHSMMTDIFTQVIKPIQFFENFKFWFTWPFRVILTIAVLGIVVFLLFDTYDQMDASLFFVPALGTILAAVVICIMERVIMRYCERGLVRRALSRIKAQSAELYEMCMPFVADYRVFQLNKARASVFAKLEDELIYNEILFKNGCKSREAVHITICNLRSVSQDTDKNSTLRLAINRCFNLGLGESGRIVNGWADNYTFKEVMGEIQAEKIKKELEEAGAEVKIVDVVI